MTAVKTKADYFALQAALAALEAKGVEEIGVGYYLADIMVDLNNVYDGLSVNEILSLRGNYDYNALYDAAGMAAGMRAESYGFDINERLGFVVY